MIKKYNQFILENKKIIIDKFDEIINNICNKIKYKKLGIIGKGDYGKVYDIGNKFILKLTLDIREVLASYSINNNFFIGSDEIYKVVSINFPIFYVLKKRKVEQLSDELKKIFMKSFIEYKEHLLLFEENKIEYMDDFFLFLNNKNIPFNKKELKKFIIGYNFLVKKAEEYNLSYDDLHMDNIGWLNGKLVCFDIAINLSKEKCEKELEKISIKKIFL